MRYFSLLFLLVLFNVSCRTLVSKKGQYTLKNKGEAFELKILSFNILTTFDPKAIKDGYPSWNTRKPHVYNVIENSKASLIALQEISPSQLEEITVKFISNFGIVHHKSYSPDAIILYDREQFKIIEKGHWVLESPLNLIHMRRIAVWAKLRHKNAGRDLMMISVHVDANKWKGKQISKLLNYILDIQKTNAPIFLAGDFNSNEKSTEYKKVISSRWLDPPDVLSTQGNIATYPYKNPTLRIDHIFYSGVSVRPISWDLIKSSSINFSDHVPVLGTFFIEKS